MRRSHLLIGANVVGFVAMVMMNILSNVRPFNGQTMADVSARYPTLFTPAGFTFGIWSVIYVLLFGFIIYQARQASKPMPGFLQKTSWLFPLTCASTSGAPT